jgi:hypothetical protein
VDAAGDPTPDAVLFDPCGCLGGAATTRRRGRDGQEQAR